jgi:hypothetical protein
MKLPENTLDWPANFAKLLRDRATRLQSDKQLSKSDAEKLAEAQIRKILETGSFLNL